MISIRGFLQLVSKVFFAGCILLAAEYTFAEAGVKADQALEQTSTSKHIKLRSLGATIREPLGLQSSVAGYLIIENEGVSADALTFVSSTQFERIEIHEHTHAEGMMRMRKVESVIIAAAKTIDFKSRGLHLMLFNPQGLKRGDKVKLQLHFASGAVLPVVADVVPVTAMD